MTLPMARDLGKFKIRVMTIAPGLFITPMTSKVDKKINEIMENSSPLGRLGLPSDFAIIV